MAQPGCGKVFSGRYESLPEIGKYIHKACEEAGFDSCATYYIETAIDEACSNIIEHGYGGENIGEIHCLYRINEKALTIILNDNGKSFDPDKIPTPDMSPNLEGRANHGLGLYLIRKIMDEVQFQSSPQTGNTLTLVKDREKKSGTPNK